MATKSLLLSCLLLGLGAAQHPASGGNQTRSILWRPSTIIDWRTRSSTPSAAFSASGAAASIEPRHLPDDDQCDHAYFMQPQKVVQIFCFSGLRFPERSGLGVPEKCKQTPGVKDFADYLEEKCPSDPTVGSRIATEVEEEVYFCATCPQSPGCVMVSELLNDHDVPFWDSTKANNESCLFLQDVSSNNQIERLRHPRDASAFAFGSKLGNISKPWIVDDPYALGRTLSETYECDSWAASRIVQAHAPAGLFCTCGIYINPYWLNQSIGIHRECEEETMMVPVMGIFEHFSEECLYPDFHKSICTSFEDQLRACNSRPQVPECQKFSQVLNHFGTPYWDDGKPNDKSFSSITPDGQSESLHRRRDVPAVVSKSTHQDTLEQRDAEEPYQPVLKPIYEDCDALEDPDIHLECVIKEVQRALCEQGLWTPGCGDLWLDGDDELPFDPAASNKNEDGSLSRRRMTAAPQQVTTESLVDGDDTLPYIRDSFQKCQDPGDYSYFHQCLDKVEEKLVEHCFLAPDLAVDFDARERCVETVHDEKLLKDCLQALPDYHVWAQCEDQVHEICSHNPTDKLCPISIERS